MSIAKLNILHLHLTDSESFPLELISYPEITKYGAFSADEIYTVADMQDLVAYASKKAVIIVPEVDSPGHTKSWANSPTFANISSCPNYPL
jgi:hexosaminidase